MAKQPNYSLAMSSIAWEPSQDSEMAKLFVANGVKKVELAPTKLWPDIVTKTPNAVSDEQIRKSLAPWNFYNIRAVAMQSMLFLRPDLTIFDSYKLRNQTKEYLRDFIRLSGRMGINTLVFGSPKNRQVSAVDDNNEIYDIAVSFFRDLGAEARRNGVVFCIEPNPTVYACNFVVNADEGAMLVNDVDDVGFKLHLDAAGMMLADDNPVQSIKDYHAILHHFHVSAPYLGDIEEDETVAHTKIAAALQQISYSNTISIEMRPDETLEGNVYRVKSAIKKAKQLYSC